MQPVAVIDILWIATKFWLIPALMLGALPVLLEKNRKSVAVKRRVSPRMFYAVAIAIGVLGVVLFAAIATVKAEVAVTAPILIVLVAAGWILWMSRLGSFDPFIGAWCTVNGVCLSLVGINLWDRPLENDMLFPGIEYLAAWGWIGQPLLVVALTHWFISQKRQSATAP